MNVKCSESLSDISNPLSLPDAHLNKMQAGCLARKTLQLLRLSSVLLDFEKTNNMISAK